MNGTPETSSTASDTSAATAPEFLTVKETQIKLSLSRPEIYRLLDSGDLTGTHYGRKRLVDAASVATFAERIRRGEFAKPLKVGAAA